MKLAMLIVAGVLTTGAIFAGIWVALPYLLLPGEPEAATNQSPPSTKTESSAALVAASSGDSTAVDGRTYATALAAADLGASVSEFAIDDYHTAILAIRGYYQTYDEASITDAVDMVYEAKSLFPELTRRDCLQYFVDAIDVNQGRGGVDNADLELYPELFEQASYIYQQLQQYHYDTYVAPIEAQKQAMREQILENQEAAISRAQGEQAAKALALRRAQEAEEERRRRNVGKSTPTSRTPVNRIGVDWRTRSRTGN